MIYAVLPEKKLSELEANLISQTLKLWPPWQGRHSEHLYFSHLAPEKTQKLLLATKEFTRASYQGLGQLTFRRPCRWPRAGPRSSTACTHPSTPPPCAWCSCTKGNRLCWGAALLQNLPSLPCQEQALGRQTPVPQQVAGDSPKHKTEQAVWVGRDWLC